MTQPDAETQLSHLLAESPATAVERWSAEASAKMAGIKAYALYGAGQLGRTVLAHLRAVGIEPVAFADDTLEKQGQFVDGLQVMRPQEAADRFGSGLGFVVTILNPMLNFVSARERLRRQTGAPVISFLDLAWRYPTEFLPYYQFELPSSLLAEANDIRRAFRLFADEESRRQFVAHLAFRLHLDYDGLPTSDHANYFPEGVLPVLSDDAVFIDCGAFDGDTVRAFLEHQDYRFGAIYAFEPDKENFEKLTAYVGGLDRDVAEKIHVFNAGVGQRSGKLRFNSAGNMSSSVSNSGDTEIDILPIQEVVTTKGPVYLKFDVEGAEREALAGCERFFDDAQTLYAISVYHRPDDLWQLPLYVASKTKDYRFYLRTQGEDGMDVICYARSG
jgi:FkbM family methyltransferase